MAQRVNLDAMIRREDFARELTDAPAPETVRELNISQLLPNSAIRRQLRKPEFQRETNHWTPDQVVKFLTSFIDGDVIPSIILWRSTNFIFVIDGAHRLSALCAWISDDYGDRTTSKEFYADEISQEQMRIANRTRRLVENTIGKYEDLDRLVGKAGTDIASIRAGAMNTRPIFLQTVVGNAKVAEDSFFAINSQGTPLDETETYLIKNRYTPVSIGARAIVRAGRGHAYWSAFNQKNQLEIIKLGGQIHELLFEPEVTTPLKTLDLPLAGSKSPVDALAVLIDYLAVCAMKPVKADDVADADEFKNDETGDRTLEVLKAGLGIAKRITGNSSESLGLHPAVYFSNDKGKHSRFLFLGMSALVAEKVRNNDDGWFREFTLARKRVEHFLLENKSVIGVVLQNLGKRTRIPKMREMFRYLVDMNTNTVPDPAEVFDHIGMTGKIINLTARTKSSRFSDDTKSQIYYRQAIESALKCPICHGLLDTTKSVSYDHITPVREKGLGIANNGQLVHPYCNSGIKG